MGWSGRQPETPHEQDGLVALLAQFREDHPEFTEEAGILLYAMIATKDVMEFRA